MEVLIFPGPHCSIPNELRSFANANAETLSSRSVFVPSLQTLAAAIKKTGPQALSPGQVAQFVIDELGAPMIPDRLVLLNEYVWSDLKWAWAPEKPGSEHHTFYPNALARTRHVSQVFSQVDFKIVSAVVQPSALFGRICAGGWSDTSRLHLEALPHFSWADFYEDLWAAQPETRHSLIVSEDVPFNSDALFEEVFGIPLDAPVAKRYAAFRAAVDVKGRRKLDRELMAQAPLQYVPKERLQALFDAHKRAADATDDASLIPRETAERVNQNYQQDLVYLAEEAAMRPAVELV